MRPSRALLLVPAAALILTSCSGSENSTDSESAASAATATTAAGAVECPTEVVAINAARSTTNYQDGEGTTWIRAGASPDLAPFIEVDPPVPVRRDDVHDLLTGEGDVITADSEIALCYREIDPTNGETLHNDFETGSGETVTVSELSPGLRAGVIDQNVGSTLIIRADVEPPAIYAVMVRELD